MANLTVVIEDAVLLRDYLRNYVGHQNRATAMQRFIERATASKACSRAAWTRDELHERQGIHR